MHRRHNELVRAIGKRVAAVAVNAKHGANFSAGCFRDVFHLVTVHAHEARNLQQPCYSLRKIGEIEVTFNLLRCPPNVTKSPRLSVP